uniref:Uncharacterized protein n=1 Tax=Solanum lycopersicum TaxID=4081 RepID=K4B4G8_SOLLC
MLLIIYYTALYRQNKIRKEIWDLGHRSSNSLGGALRATHLKILERGWRAQVSRLKLWEPRWRAEGVVTQAPLPLVAHISVGRAHRAVCLKLQELGCRASGYVILGGAQGIEPQARGSWVALKALHPKLKDHGLRSKRCASSSRSLGDTLKTSCLKPWVPWWDAQSIAPQALDTGWCLRVSRLKFLLPGRRIVPQALGFWLALKKPRASCLKLWGRVACLGRCASSSEGPSGAFRASCLTLKDLGWRAQGVAPQAPRGWVALSWHHPSRLVGADGAGIEPQPPRALVETSGHCASRSSSLGDALKAPSLKFVEPCWPAQGVSFKASGSWLSLNALHLKLNGFHISSCGFYLLGKDVPKG